MKTTIYGSNSGADTAVAVDSTGAVQTVGVAGSAILGKVGIDQTTVGTTNAVSLAQIGTTTVATGNGVVGAGVQRVAIASDNTAFNISASDETSKVFNGTTALTPKFAKIDAAASADLVALVPAKKIRVLCLFLHAALSAVTVKFQSGATTDLTGAITVGTATTMTPINLPYNPVGWFETAAGEKLNVVLSAGIQISGSLTYVEV